MARPLQRGQTVKPRSFEREYRTIQTGFQRFFDHTGGNLTRNWFQQFRPTDYAFKLPRMGLTGGSNAFSNKDINVGRLLDGDDDIAAGRGVKGGTREDTFRLQPRGIPGVGPDGNADEYSKKLLFSWALQHNSDDTTAIFGRELRQYEKPDTTKSGLGQKGAGKRITGPLPHAKQLTKFFWSTLSSKAGYELPGGGRHWGADQNTIASQGRNFRGIYEKSVLDKYRMSANKASNQAMRDLLDILPQVLTVDPSGKRSLETDSPEELMIAVAGNTISQWNTMSRAEIEEDMARLMKMTPSLRGPGGMIDIPPNSPAINRVIDTIKSTSQDAMKVKAAIAAGGLEVTEIPKRLQRIYEIDQWKVPTRAQYMFEAEIALRQDIYERYKAGGTYKPTRKDRGIGEQFYDRGVGLGGYEALTWSEPAFDGVAFFSVVIPTGQTDFFDPSYISVTSHFEPQMKGVGVRVLENNGINQNISAIRRAARSVLHGGIRDSTGATIVSNTLGTNIGPMTMGGLTGIVRTGVDISAPTDVAAELYDLVQATADNLGNMITIKASSGGTSFAFTDWIESQQQRGEDFAWKVHQSAGRGWRTWLDTIGPQAKKGTPPSDAADWPQPIHPRPFLWMTGVGQTKSKQAHKTDPSRTATGQWVK